MNTRERLTLCDMTTGVMTILLAKTTKGVAICKHVAYMYNIMYEIQDLNRNSHIK